MNMSWGVWTVGGWQTIHAYR